MSEPKKPVAQPMPEYMTDLVKAVPDKLMRDVVADARRSSPIFGERPEGETPKERRARDEENRRRDEREKAEEAIRAERQRMEDEWRRRGDAFAAGFGGPEDPNARWREERLRQQAIARLKAADPR